MSAKAIWRLMEAPEIGTRGLTRLRQERMRTLWLGEGSRADKQTSFGLYIIPRRRKPVHGTDTGTQDRRERIGTQEFPKTPCYPGILLYNPSDLTQSSEQIPVRPGAVQSQLIL